MIALSNQDRDTIISLLEKFQTDYPVKKSLRRLNYIRLAGLMVESLKNKPIIDNLRFTKFIKNEKTVDQGTIRQTD